MPEASEASEEWDARLEAAREAFDDTRLLVELMRAERRLMTSTSSAVAVLAGESALRSARRIGILSGSFNPLTNAHVALGDAAMRSGGLDALVWCCAVATIDKESVTRAMLVDRLAQLRCYAAHAPGSSVALVNRGLYVDQATLIGGLVAASADIAVVVGFDKAVQIFDPRYYADREAALARLFASARLLVAPRDGDSLDDVRRLLSRPGNIAFASWVDFLDVPSDVRTESSTEARALAGRLGDRSTSEVGRLRALVPPEGFALATTGDPYGRAAAEDVDAYLWRSRWLTEVMRHAAALGQPWPALRVLVAASLRRDARGAEVRQLVRDSLDSEGPDALLRAIELSARFG